MRLGGRVVVIGRGGDRRRGLANDEGIDQVREQFHNLHEFVAVARAKLDRNVWDYLIGGAETETTVRRNRLALDSLAFRPRVLRDVNGTDTSTTVGSRKLSNCAASTRKMRMAEKSIVVVSELPTVRS